jgi:hypothetical protein
MKFATLLAGLLMYGGVALAQEKQNCIDRQRPPKNRIATMTGVGSVGDKKAQAKSERFSMKNAPATSKAIDDECRTGRDI